MAANILVIDDTSDNLLLLGKVLSEHGYQVRRVREGNFALKIAKEYRPDLILLDIIMSSPNGYEICSQLKENESTRHIPVIFLTVKDEVIDKVKGFSIGAVDYITKPFEIEEVIARVKNQLKIASLQNQLKDQNARMRQEIKERQRVEIQLINSEKLNRSILNSAPVGICLTDGNGIFLGVNPAYCELYGFKENELIGESFTIHFSFLSKQKKAALIREYKQFIKGEKKYQKGEFTVWKKDGLQLFVDITRGIVQQDDDKFCVVTTVKDITNRKLTELALERELNRSKLLQQITEQIRSQLNTDEIFSSAARQIGRAFNVSRCHILLYKPQPIYQLLVLGEYMALEYNSLENSIIPIINNCYAQKVLSQDKAVVSNNVYADPLLKNIELKCREVKLKSFLAVRTSYKGEANGAIGLDQCDRYREWTPEEIELLEAIATQLGIAIAQAQLLEQEKQARLELARQNKALRLIVEGTAVQIGSDFFHSCTRYLAEVLEVQYALIGKLVNCSKNKARTLAFWTGETWRNNFEYDLQGTPCQKVVNGNTCLYPNNLQALFPNDHYLVELNAESYLGIPLADSNGHSLGFLAVLDTKSIVLDAAKELILKIFAARAGAELERQNIEEALQESEHTLRAIFNCSFQFMGILQPNGIVVGINQTALSFAGVEEKDIIGIPFWDTPWWDLSQKIRKQLKQAIRKAASGKFVRYEVDIIGADNRVITIDFSIKPVYDEERNLILLIPEGRDISDRKNSEKLLQHQSAAMAAATDGIGILDRQGKYIYLNDAHIRVFGYNNAAQLLGKNWQIFYDEEELKRFDEEIMPVLLREGYIRMETKGLKRDGRIFPHEVTVTLLETGERICIVRDITERKRTEEALRESQRQYQTLAEASPVGIFHADAGGNYLYVNQRWSNITGLMPENALGTGWARTIHPQDRDRILTEWSEATNTKQPFKSEYRFVRPDGKINWVIGQAQPEMEEDLNIKGYIGTITDISDRKHAEIAEKQQLKREQLVSSIQERIRSSLNLEEILTTAVNEVRYFLSTDRVLIYQILANGVRSAVTESVELGLPAIVGQTFSETLFLPESIKEYEQEKVFYLEDIDKAEASSSLLIHARQLGVKAKLVIPIFKDAEIWGLLIAHHCRKPRQWQAWEIESIRQITLQLAIAIQQAALYEQAKAEIIERKKAEEALKESAEREKALAAAIQRIRQSLDLETIFAATTEELRQVIDCDRVAIYHFNPDWTGQFVAESIANQTNNFSVMEDENKTLQIAVQKNLSNICRLQVLLNSPNIWHDTYLKETEDNRRRLQTNSLVIEDIYQANFSPCYLERLEQFQVRAYIIVPIFCGSQIWGLLAAYQHFNSRQWKKAEVNIVSQIGNQLGVALQQSELLAQTKMQSEALQKAVLAADAANRAKSEFLASMSHELRTPLNAILGFTQVMSFDNYLSQKHQENLDTINRAGEHLLTLINDILEMSKIEAGRTTLNESSFDLIYLLNSLEKMLELKAASKGLSLVFEYSSNLPELVHTDAGKLRQVLLNLLGNAIKFTEKGSVTLRVKSQILKNSSPSSTDSYCRIIFEIKDTGSGIAPEEIRLLFEPFGQTETGKKSQQGTGLGLPISRKYVQMMGGDIKVISTLDVGSLFTFDILTNAPENVSNKLPLEENKKVIGLAPNQQKYRILIIEDTPDSRVLLSKLLKPIGFDIKEASNGIEGLEIWQKWQPHLIFMDMRMPKMDGYEATKQIREKEAKKTGTKAKFSQRINKTVIIALTASAFEEQRQMILSVGCNDLICKPFSVKLLLEKISQHLGVNYLYEQNQEIVQNIEGLENFNRSELSKYLSQMSSEWLAQLYDAATECSDNMILDLIAKINLKNKALSSTLTYLAKNFLFEIIIEIIEEINND